MVANEQVFGSTLWETKQVKVRRSAGGHVTVRSAATGWGRLRRQDRRQKVTLTISWRGGAASWWLVEARGRHSVMPGFYELEDVMRLVLNEREWQKD